MGGQSSIVSLSFPLGEVTSRARGPISHPLLSSGRLYPFSFLKTWRSRSSATDQVWVGHSKITTSFCYGRLRMGCIYKVPGKRRGRFGLGAWAGMPLLPSSLRSPYFLFFFLCRQFRLESISTEDAEQDGVPLRPLLPQCLQLPFLR